MINLIDNYQVDSALDVKSRQYMLLRNLHNQANANS